VYVCFVTSAVQNASRAAQSSPPRTTALSTSQADRMHEASTRSYHTTSAGRTTVTSGAQSTQDVVKAQRSDAQPMETVRTQDVGGAAADNLSSMVTVEDCTAVIDQRPHDVSKDLKAAEFSHTVLSGGTSSADDDDSDDDDDDDDIIVISSSSPEDDSC